jgi:hypothetical protein
MYVTHIDTNPSFSRMPLYLNHVYIIMQNSIFSDNLFSNLELEQN